MIRIITSAKVPDEDSGVLQARDDAAVLAADAHGHRVRACLPLFEQSPALEIVDDYEIWIGRFKLLEKENTAHFTRHPTLSMLQQT